MKNKDKIEFNRIMQQVQDIFTRDLTPGAMDLYWECLIDYEMPEVRRALGLCVQNTDGGQYMPKPADIIRMINGDNKMQALEAWTKVYQAIGSVGPYRDVVFDDALIHKALSDMGGWIAICNITDDDAPFRANEFENRYKGYSSRGIIPEYQKVLTGISTQANSESGHKSQPPVLIGDRAMAMDVFNGGKESLKLSVVESTFKRIGK